MIDYDAGYGTLLDSTVRIATWNIWGRYGPWEQRLPAIVATLRAVDADIIGLQEVWASPDRNQAEWIAAELGFEGLVYAANLTYPHDPHVESGNAVISRWPLVRHDVLALPREGSGARDDEGEERLCVLAEVNGPRGPIQIYCAHLSWRGDHSGVRQQQVGAIGRFVRANQPRSFPAVVLGDLNSTPDSTEIRMLTGKDAVAVPGVWFRDAWAAVNPEHPGYTWSNTNPFAAASLDIDSRIDYIMTAAPKRAGCGQVLDIRMIGDQPVDGMFGSDHYGLVAELRY